MQSFRNLSLKRIASLPGLQEKWMAWIFFDLLAQTIDHVLEQDLIAIAISTPDRCDDFLQAENVARPTHQQMQQSKFQIGQTDLYASWIDEASPRRIKPMPPGFDKT
jgi:hypothetical protein